MTRREAAVVRSLRKNPCPFQCMRIKFNSVSSALTTEKPLECISASVSKAISLMENYLAVSVHRSVGPSLRENPLTVSVQAHKIQWVFVRANYLPLIFSTKEVLILPVSKHSRKDNNIYERDHKNGKAACAYMHFTQ